MAAVPPTPLVPPVAPAERPSPSNPPSATSATPSNVAGTAAKPPDTARLPLALPADVQRKLADALSGGDLAAAKALLAQNIAMEPTRLAEYRALVEAIPHPVALAEETLSRAKGQEMTIVYLGKERRIIPRAAANGEIDADFVAAEGNRPVRFRISRFSPEELLRLLPKDAETPEVHAALCMALLKANKPAEAARHIAACGVLGPVFESALQPSTPPPQP
jgi:hypothetical protein